MYAWREGAGAADRTLSKGMDEYRRMDEDGKRQLCVVSLDSWHCKKGGGGLGGKRSKGKR